MNADEQNIVEDRSADRAYFVITPQIVWAYSRNPYDLALWTVVKMIAGDDGECYLSTPDLAALAMMSAGQVTKSRRHLLSVGLLHGEIRRDPGYPQPVWHLRVPDVWQKNLAWRLTHNGLKDRVEFKRAQKTGSVHQVNALPKERSPGERGPSPGERGPSPGETKNIHRISIEQPHAAVAVETESLESSSNVLDREPDATSVHLVNAPSVYTETGDGKEVRAALADFAEALGVRLTEDYVKTIVGLEPDPAALRAWAAQTERKWRAGRVKSPTGYLLKAVQDGWQPDPARPDPEEGMIKGPTDYAALDLW